MIYPTRATEGSARAWGGVCNDNAAKDGATSVTDMHDTDVAKAPSRGEGRALPGVPPGGTSIS